MKKIIIAGLLLLGITPLAQARVTVTNNTPWPIKFTYYWAGKLPVMVDGKLTWRDSYEWPNPILPEKSDTQEADVGNIKNRYVVTVVMNDGSEKVMLDTPTVEAGDRKINVNTQIKDVTTGAVVIRLDSALM